CVVASSRMQQPQLWGCNAPQLCGALSAAAACSTASMLPSCPRVPSFSSLREPWETGEAGRGGGVSEELADCVVVFSLALGDGAQAAATISAPQSAPDDGQPGGQPSGVLPPLGDPLPAHRVALFGCSARLRAQAERWTPEQRQAGRKPELRVPLGSLEDMPHALSALRFMYTGKVDGSSAAQLLQVRRHSAYLLVEGCVEACDAALLARVSAKATQPQQLAEGAVGSGSSSPLAPVAELFACRHLLPEPEESGGDSATAALLRACRQQLVLHGGGPAEVVGAAGQGASGRSGSLGELLAWAFRDAPSLLCDPDTRRQMVALPAAAMEALLGSDSFPTDDEATVLLVLAHWRAANLAAFVPMCDKLCRLVRLSQLPEDYVLGTLPHILWFPLSRDEHTFLCQHVSAAGQPNKRARLKEAAVGRHDTTSPWYAAGARPCGRSDLDRPYGWHVKEEDLAKVAEHAAMIALHGSFDNGALRLVSRGFEWRLFMCMKAEDEAAGVYLRCGTPAALGLSVSVEPIALVSTSAHLVVHRWAGEGGSTSREVAYAHRFSRTADYMKVGSGLGRPSALPLAKAQGTGAQGGDGAADSLHSCVVASSRLQQPQLWGCNAPQLCGALSAAAASSTASMLPSCPRVPSFSSLREPWETGEAGRGVGAQRWTAEQQQAGSKPELRVPLGSPEDLPRVLGALRFMYTGKAEGASSSSSSSSSSSPLAPVAELFACRHLLPEPEESGSDAATASLLPACRQQLVLHGGGFAEVFDTAGQSGASGGCASLGELLAMEALPAAAMEALLGSDSFTTDDEAMDRLAGSNRIGVNASFMWDDDGWAVNGARPLAALMPATGMHGGRVAERWTAEQQQAGSKPELRVPLGRPEDLPHALSALRFMYTGKLDGSSAAQLLQVRRQAAYLLVEGLGAPPRAAAASAARPLPLWPSCSPAATCCRSLKKGGDTATAALLRACRQQLVLHSGSAAAVVGVITSSGSGSLGELLAWAFRDAPSLLCDPDTRRQMEALPAAAMEALLGSDSSTTDDEATVLLVLAHWRAANLAAFVPVCDKLCGLVRLSQLPEDYLLGMLPHIPWFPLSRDEHTFLCQHVSAAGQRTKRARLEELAVGRYDTASPWYAAGARPCGRSDLNRPYGWHIKQEDLLAEVAEQMGTNALDGSFDNGASYHMALSGYLSLSRKRGMRRPEFLWCVTPVAFGLPITVKPIALVSTSARLVVHRWGGEDGGGSLQEACSIRFSRGNDYMKVGGLSWAQPSTLPLAKVQDAGMQGGDGAAGPLHSEELADCLVVFCLALAGGAQATAGASEAPAMTTASAPQSAPGDGQPSGVFPPLGDPLPAHRVALFGGSARLRAQAERWTAEQQQAGSKPELRVLLRSPEDLPHALSALRFMYTGKVDGGSAAQLLQVRRQAAYLLVEGCVEACDAALLARVRPGVPPQQAEGASSSSSSSSPLAPVAELFACRHLLPEPEESGGDTLIPALLRACRQQLVLHSGGAAGDADAAGSGASGGSGSLSELMAWAFRDVPSLPCDPDTRRQMEALPAAAMEALLGSDSFATDDEATVLLVLAHWRAANLAAFVPVCDKLCRLVRLSQLPEDYLLGVLPHIPWFPLSREEHTFLCQHVLAVGQPSKRARLKELAVGQYDTASPWYAAGSRPCERSDLNRPYGWHIKQGDLAKSLDGSFDNGAAGLVSHGFEWWPSIEMEAGDEAAGVYLACCTPAALGLPVSVKPISLTSTSARLVVHCWVGEDGGRSRQEAYSKHYSRDNDYVKVGWGWGSPSALPLAKVQDAGVQGGDGAANLLHRWGAYLHEGKLTGSLEFV
ncbi:hypothetical protein TSOC_006454, partial [Tetrabaena socialis]